MEYKGFLQAPSLFSNHNHKQNGVQEMGFNLQLLIVIPLHAVLETYVAILPRLCLEMNLQKAKT